MRKNKSKTWREIPAFDYRSVRFRATDSDWVAFRVICQDPNKMKTQNNNPFSLEWVIFSCCREATFPVHSSKQPISLRWFDEPWQLNDRILKHCKTKKHGARRRKQNISCLQFEDPKKLITTVVWLSRSDYRGAIRGKIGQNLRRCVNTFERTSRPKIQGHPTVPFGEYLFGRSKLAWDFRI